MTILVGMGRSGRRKEVVKQRRTCRVSDFAKMIAYLSCIAAITVAISLFFGFLRRRGRRN
jgi:hypothetical protein